MLSKKYTADEWYSLLVGESLLLDLLGRVLYTNPTRNWIEPLVAEGLFEDVPFASQQEDVIRGLDLLAAWTAATAGNISDATVSDLRVDFAHLFIGNNPMRVPPWESVYFSEERLTFQQPAIDVERWFGQLGLQINTENKEPNDHIAFELSFVARCAEMASTAQNNQQDDLFVRLLSIQQQFLEKHLLRWGGKWAELAYENARTDFYRGIALIVQGAMLELGQVFDVEIPSKIRYPGLMY